MPQTLLRDGLAQLITGRFAAQQQELPVNPGSLTRWRQRPGESGMESLLSATVEAAIESKAVKARDRKRERRVRLAKAHGVPLRQSYVRVGPACCLRTTVTGTHTHDRHGKATNG